MSLNRQLILDDVFAALIKQGQLAMTQDGCCRYRVEGTDLKCAVGRLIPDAAYTPDMEGEQLKSIADSIDPKYGQSPEAADIQFLAEIQAAHDHIEPHDFIFDLRINFNKVANDYNLKAPTA